MQSAASTPEQYLNELSDERKQVINKIRSIILENLPAGFKEEMSYGMLGYIVPKTNYPNGYHCNPKLPLPFLALASQKNFIALYHMGIYSSEAVMAWFKNEYAKTGCKLDMGKSCLRFSKFDKIPYELIGELCQKFTVNDWITIYEKLYLKNK